MAELKQSRLSFPHWYMFKDKRRTCWTWLWLCIYVQRSECVMCLAEGRDAERWSQCLHQLLRDSAAVCPSLHLQAAGGKHSLLTILFAQCIIVFYLSSSSSSLRARRRGQGRCVVRLKFCSNFTPHRTISLLFCKTWRKRFHLTDFWAKNRTRECFFL